MAHQNSKEENQNKGPSAPNDAPKAKDISGEDAYKIVGAQGYRQRNVFPIEEMERGESDVLHFLFAKNEALIGRGIVRLRDIGSGHRGSRCTTEQRKTESDCTQPRHGGGLGRAFLPRSLLDPSHGRSLSSCERAWRSKFALGESGAQDLPARHKMKWNLGKRKFPSSCRHICVVFILPRVR